MLTLGPSHMVFLSEHSFYVGELVFEHSSKEDSTKNMNFCCTKSMEIL